MADIAYSIIIPCYHSEPSISELLDRLLSAMNQLGFSFEILCIDDGSPDRVADLIKEKRLSDSRIKLIRHYRNYGQHQAILTGIRHSQGEVIITLDDDLQNPPEEIPRLIAAFGDYDVLIGAPAIKKDRIHKNLGSYLMRLVLRFIFRPPQGFISSTFRIMRRTIADKLADSPTIYPYISGMILQITRNVGTISVAHERRRSGRSTYTIRKLLALASNLIINYSRIPLQIIVVAGIITSLLSLFAIAFIVITKLLYIDFAAGWASLISVICFFGGLQLISIAMIGEYLLRLLNTQEGLSRPIIKETLL